LRRWKSIQDRYYDETLSIFSSLPVIRVPLLEQEIVGLPMLRSLAAALHDGRRPTDFLAEEPPYYMGKNNGHYMLSFSLPNTSRDEISVERSDGDELIVCVGDYRRNIMLPSSFAKATVSSARFEGNNLVIKFEKPRRTGQQPELKARRPTHDSR
jgi:arsenite-transporting ATPase